jgi:predicted amidohydrolase
LHEGEEVTYVAGAEHNPLIELEGERISLAICADITHDEHAANAARRNTSLYIAGIFYTPGGIAEGHTNLSEYARMYNMNVLMANYGGPSLRLDSAGQSAFWTAGGALETAANTTGEGLVIATKENNTWTGRVITAGLTS